MLRLRICLLVGLILAVCMMASPRAVSPKASRQAAASSQLTLHESRTDASDLEIAGELDGLPHGSTRYIALADLRALQQESYTVTGDPNFSGAAKISGVPLAELARAVNASLSADLIVAICKDQYRADFSRAYIAAHQPVLVLEIDGHAPSEWPKGSDGQAPMGPFLISNPNFAPSYSILTQPERAQVPWGVVRLEFRNEQSVVGAISPVGPHYQDPAVQNGFSLAQQNCFSCHSSGDEGGQKAGVPWMALSIKANASPDSFAAYVRNPQAINKNTKMEGNPGYDDRAMQALIAYFQTFSEEPPE